MSKVLVITGGSRGIGLATCRLFVERGYRVVNLSRSFHPMPEVEHLAADLADVNWVAPIKSELLRRVRGADSICLVHNAANALGGTTADLTGSDLLRALQTNVVAAVELNGLLLPAMHEGSSILYVGSTLSEKAVAGSCAYVVSKHAQLGLMRSGCQDLMGSGVHTACICPGFTDTEMLREHIGSDSEALQSISALCSYNRLVQPEEIANTLMFCAENAVINGSVIHANLGQKES